MGILSLSNEKFLIVEKIFELQCGAPYSNELIWHRMVFCKSLPHIRGREFACNDQWGANRFIFLRA